MALYVIIGLASIIVCVGIFVVRAVMYVSETLLSVKKSLDRVADRNDTRNSYLDRLVQVQYDMLEVFERNGELTQAIFDFQREMHQFKMDERVQLGKFNESILHGVPLEVMHAYGVNSVDELPDEVRDLYKQEVK